MTSIRGLALIVLNSALNVVKHLSARYPLAQRGSFKCVENSFIGRCDEQRPTLFTEAPLGIDQYLQCGELKIEHCTEIE